MEEEDKEDKEAVSRKSGRSRVVLLGGRYLLSRPI
jgi:hypothetical protein